MSSTTTKKIIGQGVKLNTNYFTIHDLREFFPDNKQPHNFMTSLKNRGVCYETKLVVRPRKDIGRGKLARVYNTYMDLEDAIDRFLELTAEDTNYSRHHLNTLDKLFILRGRINEREKLRSLQRL